MARRKEIIPVTETKRKKETVTTAELAALLNLSIPSIKKLQQDGVIKPLPNNGNRKAGNEWEALQCACNVIRNYQTMVKSRSSIESEEMKNAKEREKIAKAKHAELDLAQREGELVDADRIVAAIGSVLNRLRINLLSIPKGIAPQLRNMDNSNEISQKIYERIARIMHDTVNLNWGKILEKEFE